MILLLPAPKIAGLLPAFATPAPELVVRPLAALNTDEEVLLENMYRHYQAVLKGTIRGSGDGVAWYPVGQTSRDAADMLVTYGYVEKHPSNRRKMWYRLTPDGLLRGKMIPATTTDDPMPRDGQQLLEWRRRQNLARLTREMNMAGYVPYNEIGRGPRFGEQAFYNLFTGRMVLYKTLIGSYKWRQADMYYVPGDPQFDVASHLAALEKAGF